MAGDRWSFQPVRRPATPNQMDLFDPKPELQRWHGKPLPPSMTKDLKLAFIKPTASLLGSPFRFEKYGQCGMGLSELLLHTSRRADDICLVRSMYSEAFNHPPGQLLLFTGATQFGGPDQDADGEFVETRCRKPRDAGGGRLGRNKKRVFGRIRG